MNLSMIRGDSKRFAFPLTNGNGDPINLTDATITMSAKLAYTEAGVVFAKTDLDGITVTDAETGLVLVELEPADTSDLASRKVRLVYDIQVVIAGSVSTPVRGTLTVHPDVSILEES